MQIVWTIVSRLIYIGTKNWRVEFGKAQATYNIRSFQHSWMNKENKIMKIWQHHLFPDGSKKEDMQLV